MLLLMAAGVQAFFIPPYAVPVDRLVRNAEAYLAKHPNQSSAHYTLARIHYLAFHVKRDQAPALECDESGSLPPVPAPQWMVSWVTYGDPKDPNAAAVLNDEQLIEHAASAAQGFADSLRLRPQNGLCLLGLASFFEEFVVWKEQARPGDLPEVLRDITMDKARDAYAKAFALAIGMDSKIVTKPLSGLQNLISYEAARAIIRLAEKQKPASESEQSDLKQAKEAVAKFQALPRGGVTPIVFSLETGSPHLADWLAPEKVVDFDLRGYGWNEKWTWVKPTLGILIWDPLKRGQVTSARELFGGYTFQIFRDTGYDALAALDDNGDGVLSSAELEGVSVWFDRNGNGKSDAGEVMPVKDVGVTAISVTATGHDGMQPMNARGLVMKDGRILPTWDWIAEPVVKGRLARR